MAAGMTFRIPGATSVKDYKPEKLIIYKDYHPWFDTFQGKEYLNAQADKQRHTESDKGN